MPRMIRANEATTIQTRRNPLCLRPNLFLTSREISKPTASDVASDSVIEFIFSGERFSAPNPTDSAHFHYFYHVPLACQPVTHQRGRIWVARIVRPALVLNYPILSRRKKCQIMTLTKRIRIITLNFEYLSLPSVRSTGNGSSVFQYLLGFRPN